MLAKDLLAAAFALGVISLLAAPVGGAVEGWTIFAASYTIFVGDPINVTVAGPQFQNARVDIYLRDPNNTIVQYDQEQLLNGSVFFVYPLPLEATAGIWHVSVLVGTHEVGGLEITVVYDEINYVQKRLSLLEAQNARQEQRINSLTAANTYLQHQQDGMIWQTMFVAIVGAFVFFILFFYWWPVQKVFLHYNFPFDKIAGRWGSVAKWLADHFGRVDQRAWHAEIRTVTNPRRLDPIILANARKQRFATIPPPRKRLMKVAKSVKERET